MPRTPKAYGKLNVTKEAANIKKKAEELLENSPDENMKLALIKAGAGIGINTLIRAAAGDKSLEGLSATNMVSAADKLVRLYMEVLGEDAFKDLVESAPKIEEGVTEEQEEDSPPGNVSFIQRYTEK